ncbi:MAG TPA: hypothetical protein VF758_06995, partial [Candidatus Acidoferrum sp.]
FKRPTAYKRARLILTLVAVLFAAGWIAWRSLSHDSRVYSSGRMSGAHAVLEQQCAACHLRKAGEFSAKAADSACLACHDGPVHHENQLKAAVPACATCHLEHRGRINLSAASNQSCAECHGNLTAAGGTSYAKHIRSFEDGHPEFAALRDDSRDPGTILLNHAIHMKPIRRGPNGPIVQMECADCHRPPAVRAAWPYGDARYVDASVTYTNLDVVLAPKGGVLASRFAPRGREHMEPVKFAAACAACHLLTFDKRFEEGVPHDKPEVVHAFVVKKLQEYIAAHAAELRVVRDPNRDLVEKPRLPEARLLTPAQWVAERTADAEALLWRKTCKQCHALEITQGTSLPRVVPARLTERWLPHARFDHDAHRGFSCTGCHGKALTSTETGDVLVPGIENCRACHAPGPEHAESRCFECHTYHDWSKRKEVKPTFTLPGLRVYRNDLTESVGRQDQQVHDRRGTGKRGNE